MAWKLGGLVGRSCLFCFVLFFPQSRSRRNTILFMWRVNSWACRASELVWSWCWKGCVFHYIWLRYLFRTVTIYSDILFWTFLFRNTKLSIKKKKPHKQTNKNKTNDPCFPIFWVGRKGENKHLFFQALDKIFWTKKNWSVKILLYKYS